MNTISWADKTHEFQCFDAPGTWADNSGKKTVWRGQLKNQFNCPNSVREIMR